MNYWVICSVPPWCVVTGNGGGGTNRNLLLQLDHTNIMAEALNQNGVLYSRQDGKELRLSPK
jgi:hypothetical protein